MKKGNTTTQGKQQPDRVPEKPTGMTELTEKDLEQVQGGFGASNPADTGYPNAKIPPGPAQIKYEWVK